MHTKDCLSTRTEMCCPQCGQEFVLAEPTDVLASRPFQVDLVCPDCHFPGRALLSETSHFQPVHPSPEAASPVGVAREKDAWLTASAFDPQPIFRRPPDRALEREHPGLFPLN